MGIKGRVDKMVVLACEECKERNYTTTKNKKTIDKGRVIYYNVRLFGVKFSSKNYVNRVNW